MLFQDLAECDKKLIELMRRINFGRLENLCIHDGCIEIIPGSRMISSFSMEHQDNPYQPARDDGNFLLSEKHLRFLHKLHETGNGKVFCIQIAGGLPVKIELEEAMSM